MSNIRRRYDRYLPHQNRYRATVLFTGVPLSMYTFTIDDIILTAGNGQDESQLFSTPDDSAVNLASDTTPWSLEAVPATSVGKV